MKQNIFLLGFMGAGKSYWGRKIANNIGWSFIDLDATIEKGEGISINSIFDTKGAQVFRNLEQQYLHRLANETKTIVALGGGTPCFFDNMNWINQQGRSVYLNIPTTVLVNRLLEDHADRPLLKGKSEEEIMAFVEQKIAERRPYYEQAQYQLSKPTLEKFLKIIAH